MKKIFLFVAAIVCVGAGCAMTNEVQDERVQTPTSTVHITVPTSTDTIAIRQFEDQIKAYVAENDYSAMSVNDKVNDDGVAGIDETYQSFIEVRYDDVTGDGVPEALVPIDSFGTAGVVGYDIFGLKGKTFTLLEHIDGYKMNAYGNDSGNLVVVQPEYLDGDANSDPTFLTTERYTWNGKKFVFVDSSQKKLK